MLTPLPRWFAHRGGGSLAPENTLAGIRLAASMGFRAVEFDVMLSADATPLLIHDETLARTTNGSGHGHGVGTVGQHHAHAGAGLAVQARGDGEVFCAQLDARHVFQAHGGAVGGGLENDLLELFLGLQLAARGDGGVELLLAHGGQGPQLACRYLRVLRIDGAADV